MSLALVVSSDVAGDPRVQRWVSAYANAGHSPLVIAHANSSRAGRRPFDGCEVKAFSNERPEGEGSVAARLRSRLRFIRWAGRQVRKSGCSAVHLNDVDTLPLLASRRIRSLLTVFDAHELWPDMGHARMVSLVGRILERLGARRVDAFVTVSESVRRIIADRTGRRGPQFVVHNMPSTSEVAAATAEADRREREPGTLRALFQGRLGPGRGLETLAAASRSLPPGLEIVVQGPGDLPADSGSKLTVWPPVALGEVGLHAAKADVGLNLLETTSLNNRVGLGNKVFLFAALGLPMLLSPTPGHREARDLGVVAEFADANDPAAVARTLSGMEEGYADLHAGAVAIRDRFRFEAAAAPYLDWLSDGGT